MPFILRSVPVPPSEKHPNTTMLPPPCVTVGMGFFGLQASPFSSKHNGDHYGQTVLFLFHQTRGHSSKKYDLCLHVQLQTVVWLFLIAVWSSGFFLAGRPFRLCRYRTHFTVDIDTVVPISSSIFTRSFAVVLGLICTFRTKVHSSLGDRTAMLNCNAAGFLMLNRFRVYQEWSTTQRTSSQLDTTVESIGVNMSQDLCGTLSTPCRVHALMK